MTDASLDILVLADFHHARPGERGRMALDASLFLTAPLLMRKAIQRLQHEGVDIGLIVVMGDILDDAETAWAEADLAEIAAELRKFNVPVLTVPGNHDGNPARVARIFGTPPGLHCVGGYGFLVFHDAYQPGDVCARSPSDLNLPARMAAEHPGLPLVALQHNPLHPPIESEYPYTPTNAGAMMASYRDAGVMLSLSGHYHEGQAPHASDGVAYATVPALCEAPFSFAHVRLRGRDAKVRFHALRMDTPGLVDVHCHTEYAYCRTTVAAELNAGISLALGLRGLCLTEHAFQLYFPPEEAWSWRWQTDDALGRRAWDGGRGRMPEYRRFAGDHKNDCVRLGLEVDLRSDGSLLLAEEDREGLDLLVGAVHALPGLDRSNMRQSEAESRFMRETERLLAHPIQVLAHPFRYFRRSSLVCPMRLYRPVAELLAERGVAAEINFHVNRPDPVFVAECLSRGVKIALGTDSHDLVEVAELSPHLAVLRAAGARDEDLPRIVCRPE